MRPFPHARFTPALALIGALVIGSPARARVDSDSTRHTTPSHASSAGGYSIPACAAGFRLATIVRFPIGLGLGMAVCVTGVALDLDARLHEGSRH